MVSNSSISQKNTSDGISIFPVMKCLSYKLKIDLWQNSDLTNV